MLSTNKNVTNQKISKATTEKFHHYQDLLFNSLPVMYYSCSVDENMRTVWISDKANEITGYDSDDFTSSPNFWENNISPDDREKVLEQFTNIFRSKNVEMIYKWKCADGKYRWFMDRAVLIKDNDNNPIEILGIWLDINEKKLAESEIEINRLLTQKVLDTTPGILFVFDLKSLKTIYSNYSSKDFIGYSSEEIHQYGSEVGNYLLHPDDLPAVNSAVAELNNSSDGTVKSLEVRFKDRNGNYYWFDIRLTIFTRDDNNEAMQVIGLLQNIDDSKIIKDALKESELSYRNLFNTIEDAIYIQDANGSFVDVNNGAIKMYGYDREEFIGKTPDFLSAPGMNDFEELKKNINDACNGKPQQFEFWGKKKNGEIFLKLVKLYNGLHFGKNVIFAHAQDITKRKQAEEKMQSTLSEKNVLLREVHHRVKNNLQAMIYLIEMQIEKLEDPKVQIFLRELQEQARTMSLVYEQLYQSEYLASVDMEAYLFNLTSNVVQVFGLGKEIQFKVNVKNVALDVETAMPCGLFVNELLTNSLKYAFPEGSTINPTINVDVKLESNEVVIIVEDNGVGLPMDYDWENTESLGLKLVNFWVKYQLAGSINLEVTNGTKYVIKFGYDRKK